MTVIENYGGEDQIGVMGYGVRLPDFDPDDHGDGTPYGSANPSQYPPSDNEWVGVLEGELTDDFSALRDNVLSSSNLQSSKYGGGTPIGAGVRDSAHYLENSPLARETVNTVPVRKVIVLMSDGYANKPSGDGDGYARDMAVIAPNNPETYNNLGNVHSDLGNFRSAIACFQKTLQVNPANAVAHNSLALTFAQAGNFSEADRHFRRALEINPDDSKTHYKFGVFLAHEKDYERAALHFRTTLRFDPENTAAKRKLELIRLIQQRSADRVQ